MINIKNIYDQVIYTSNKLTIKEAVEEAIFKKISLFGADLSGTDLRGADLRGANLIEANLYGANLSEANLSQKKNFKILL